MARSKREELVVKITLPHFHTAIHHSGYKGFMGHNPNIEIVIKIDATNTVSWQLAEKVGFKSVGFYQIDGVTIMMYSSNPQGVEQ